MIKVYVHTPLMRGWESVVENLLLRMAKSKLISEADKIIFCVNGSVDENENKLILENISRLSKNIEVQLVHNNYNKWEYPTIDYLKKDVDQSTDDFYVCYVHLKGLSRKNLQDQTAIDWRHYLEYWTIDQWRDNVVALDNGFDTSGVNWLEWPWKHHSGNFWWATSRYIKTLQYLQDPTTVKLNTPSRLMKNTLLSEKNLRFEAEAWIGSGNAKSHEIHSSPGKINLEFHYKYEYPESEYKK